MGIFCFHTIYFLFFRPRKHCFSYFWKNNTHYQSVILNKNVYLHCSTGEMVGLNIESVFALFCNWNRQNSKQKDKEQYDAHFLFGYVLGTANIVSIDIAYKRGSIVSSYSFLYGVWRRLVAMNSRTSPHAFLST